MFSTTEQARLAALKEQTAKREAAGRRLTPLARRIIGLDR